MVEKYNNTYHRSIKLKRPSDARNKGFTPNCTEEVFTISSVKATKPPTYTIKDILGDEYTGNIPYRTRRRRRRKNKYLSSGKVKATRSIRGYH